MRRSTQDLLGMSSKLIAGTCVSVIHEGQKYNGIVTACRYTCDKYIVSLMKRFTNETFVVERRGYQLGLPIDERLPELINSDYEEDYVISNMV